MQQTEGVCLNPKPSSTQDTSGKQSKEDRRESEGREGKGISRSVEPRPYQKEEEEEEVRALTSLLCKARRPFHKIWKCG